MQKNESPFSGNMFCVVKSGVEKAFIDIINKRAIRKTEQKPGE